MKIAIAADHAGFNLKQVLRERLIAQGHQVEDLGTDSLDSVDYPDFAAAVGRRVSSGEAERGVLVCSSGVGMSMAANKIRGVRAALAYDAEEVRVTRAHNDANVLAIGARFSSQPAAEQMLDVFLATGFDGGRHSRRIQKMKQLEQEEANHE
ncbi:MAG: ribose 5-phosphate isomerase B [Acidobacteria bacterium]|nr:ribose 5-phosphate isomerase B [Acidobacteriota bacterium]